MASSTIAPADYKFWEYLNDVVQGEPSDSFDQIRLGFLASIGIEKGKPFAPDARMKKILTEAAAVGDATAPTIAFKIRQKEDYYYENSSWRRPFFGGYEFQSQPGSRSPLYGTRFGVATLLFNTFKTISTRLVGRHCPTHTGPHDWSTSWFQTVANGY